MLTRIAACLAVLAVSTVALAADPTDNPVATYYSGPEGYPAWTDSIQWANVINMKAYAKGKTEFEKFEAARDELAGKGGGVLYYPAGTYDFSQGPFDGPTGRGLMLKTGVVIRGEAPAGHPTPAKDGKLDLPTKFIFGFQKKTGGEGDKKWTGEVPHDWNLIGLCPDAGKGIKDVNNVGIAWVHMVGATVYFGADMPWAPTWKEGKSWKTPYAKPAWAARKPDGTHPYDPFMGCPANSTWVGAGKGRLVFGCVLEKSALLNDFDTGGRKEAPEGYGEKGFHMAKFAGRVSVYGSRVFVAANVLPKSDGNFAYEQTTVQTIPRKGNDFAIGQPRQSTVLWDYGRVMGLDINKDLCAMCAASIHKEMKGGFYEEGVTAIDNWVFNNGHKGYNISGKWVVIHNNRNERTFLDAGKDPYGIGGWRLTLDGFTESSAGGGGMISDNLARAFDLGGWNMWIDSNSYNNTGSNPGNDGEGIVCQAHGGTEVFSWVITHNDGSGAGNGRGYMEAWAVTVHGMLIAWNATAGDVGGMNCKDESDSVYVANKCKKVLGKGGNNLPTGQPAAPKDVKAEVYEGDAVKITWADASDNEIGFRIDRSLDGGKNWAKIAYRPPHIEGAPDNPQAWIDFLAPRGKALTYRVTAVSVEDTDAGASQPAAVTLPAVGAK